MLSSRTITLFSLITVLIILIIITASITFLSSLFYWVSCPIPNQSSLLIQIQSKYLTLAFCHLLLVAASNNFSLTPWLYTFNLFPDHARFNIASNQASLLLEWEFMF